jgi:hypothetical protein
VNYSGTKVVVMKLEKQKQTHNHTENTDIKLYFQKWFSDWFSWSLNDVASWCSIFGNTGRKILTLQVHVKFYMQVYTTPSLHVHLNYHNIKTFFLLIIKTYLNTAPAATPKFLGLKSYEEWSTGINLINIVQQWCNLLAKQ